MKCPFAAVPEVTRVISCVTGDAIHRRRECEQRSGDSARKER